MAVSKLFFERALHASSSVSETRGYLSSSLPTFRKNVCNASPSSLNACTVSISLAQQAFDLFRRCGLVLFYQRF
jgi:hypothetical protein